MGEEKETKNNKKISLGQGNDARRVQAKPVREESSGRRYLRGKRGDRASSTSEGRSGIRERKSSQRVKISEKKAIEGRGD